MIRFVPCLILLNIAWIQTHPNAIPKKDDLSIKALVKALRHAAIKLRHGNLTNQHAGPNDHGSTMEPNQHAGNSARIDPHTHEIHADAEHSPWNYQPETAKDPYGPYQWSTTFPTCGGTAQSPIDIAGEVSKGPCELTMTEGWDGNLSGKWKPNGHNLQFTLDEEVAKKSMVEAPCLDAKYMLIQMHLHWGATSKSGSEHTINGKSYPMEMHMVHVAENDHNKYMVIGILFEEGVDPKYGEEQKFLNLFKTVTKDGINGIHSPQTAETYPGTIDVTAYVSISGVRESHFQYQGSLTTPPCTESVMWVIAPKHPKVTAEALEHLRMMQKDWDGYILTHNNRPVQDINGRTIELYA